MQHGEEPRKLAIYGTVSIPLSRDSLCTLKKVGTALVTFADAFQSLYRGTAFATEELDAFLDDCIDRFQSLYRGTAFATESLQKP